MLNRFISRLSLLPRTQAFSTCTIAPTRKLSSLLLSKHNQPTMVRYYPSVPSSPDSNNEGTLRIRGVVFDMDGTLVTPMTKYLQLMRIELSIPDGVDILAYVEGHMQGEAKLKAEARIKEIEDMALAHMKLSPGLIGLLRYLNELSIPIAIITRNNAGSVDYFMDHVVSKESDDVKELFHFDPVISREFKPTKPHPASILHISDVWGIDPKYLLMVGDHADDLACGVRAGTISALLRYPDNAEFASLAHIVVDRIDGIVEYLRDGFDANTDITGELDPSIYKIRGGV